MVSRSLGQLCISVVTVSNRMLRRWSVLQPVGTGEEKLPSRHRFLLSNRCGCCEANLCLLSCSFYPSSAWNMMYHHLSGSICGVFFFYPLARGSACETKKEKNYVGNKNSCSEKGRLRVNKKGSCTFPDKLRVKTTLSVAVLCWKMQ